MSRPGAGILITIAMLAMQARSGSPARSAENAPLPSARPAEPGPPVPQSRRVLGLILALEALRAAPELANRPKV